LHLAGGVLLGRAYWGCYGEAHWVEEFESNLPMPVFGFGVARIMLVGVDGGGGARAVGGAGEKGLGGNRMLSARAPREHEDAPGVAVVLGLPLGWPVRGEPELAGGGAEEERRRERVWVRFCARGAQLEGGEASWVVGWSNVGLWWPVRAS